MGLKVFNLIFMRSEFFKRLARGGQFAERMLKLKLNGPI